MDKKELNNVIPFPGPKARTEQKPADKTPKAPKPSKKKALVENKKLLISSSLLSIVFVVTMANRNLMKAEEASIQWVGNEQVNSRSIASVEHTRFERNADWEKDVAQELSQSLGRKPASISSTASDEQQFRYGFLGTAYRVLYNANGKVEEIVYDPAPLAKSDSKSDDESKLKYLSAADILDGKYKSFLPWSYTNWTNTEKKTIQNEIVEVISLLGRDGKTVGLVTFKTDVHGRFLSMKAQSI